MKQAFLITAYKNFEALYELSSHLAKAAYVYVHVDNASEEIGPSQMSMLNAIENCQAVKIFQIPWGGFTHVSAICKLIELAIANKDVAYVHMLTGEDMPVVSLEELDQRFMQDTHIYMDVIPSSAFTPQVVKRYRYHNYFQNRNVKNPWLWKLQDITVSIQKMLGVHKTSIGEFTEDKLYKGLVYASMPKEVAEYVLTYCAEHTQFLKDLADCQIPEEFFFQTILMNSPYKEQISDAKVRYLNWEKGDGGSPAYLDMSDYEAIKAGGYVFARKFGKGVSDELKQMLLNDIANKR